MGPKNSDRIRTLLKGIETGDPASVSVINPDKYIQHNPQTLEGRDGLAACDDDHRVRDRLHHVEDVAGEQHGSSIVAVGA